MRISLAGTGTGEGWSYIQGKLIGCAKRNELRKENRRSGLTGIRPMDIGTVGHALLAEFYKLPQADRDLLDTRNIQWVDTGNVSAEYLIDVTDEALRRFRSYRLQDTNFGRVSAVEELISSPGVPPIRPDLIAFIGTTRIKEMFPLAAAGTYLVDHKFYGRVGPHDHQAIQNDLRFTFYNHMFVVHRGRDVGFKGTIVNAIYGDADPVTVKRFLVHYPGSKVNRIRLNKYLKLAKEADPLRPAPECINRFSKCEFFGTHCSGY